MFSFLNKCFRFTYDKNPRALIFKRDHTEVTDLYTLLDLLRSNDYKRDYYGKCKCKPPYSAENALAARLVFKMI